MNRINKVRQKLTSLRYQIKVAAAASAIILCLETSSEVKAQATLGPFVQQKRSQNPLRGSLELASEPSPAVVDLDNDGDYEVIVGEKYGTLRYFHNAGTATNPLFDELVDSENPLNSISVSNRPAPVFIDLDKDGDQDLFVGQGDGTIRYFENTGSPTAPAFTERTGSENPLSEISIGGQVSPTFADLDKDGDLDLLIGTDYGYNTNYQSIFYYENNGSNSFTQSSIGIPETFDYAVVVATADIDNDGDIEILTGDQYGSLKLFTQATEPLSYTELTGNSNPFNDFYGSYASPVFADMDDDGDMDLIVGHSDFSYTRTLAYFENTGNGAYEKKIATDNPFEGIDVGRRASLLLLDYDSDGDLDAVVGNKYGSSLTYYSNDNGTYNIKENSLSSLESFGYFTPELQDIDADGDLDIITGNFGGTIDFFRNDEGIYNLINPANEGPFTGIDGGFAIVPDLVDIDADGDLDMFIGNNQGLIAYYENTGTPSAPSFSLEADNNPLAFIDYGANAVIHFSDVDHDGDYDLCVGSYDNNDEEWVIDYYENTGTPTSPSFALGNNQFANEFVVPSAIPRLFDIDGDGDLDLFVGTNEGTILYSKNENPAPQVSVNTTSATISVEPGSSLSIIDDQLTLADSDADEIIEARVAIEGYESEDALVLSFTPQGNITGSFDPETGILTLKGRASVSTYQSVLRTVSIGPASGGGGANQASGRSSKGDFNRNISFSAYDIDYTNPVPASRAITFSEGEVVVFNAVAPNSSGDNKWMRILNLPVENKVSIYNRWGDKVYEMKNYDSNQEGKRFEGLSDGGKELATGTYFYKIEFGSETITGYLSLKQ